MSKWTLSDLSDLPDQSGRAVVVTGASSGLGLIVARELAAAGASVVLAVRDVAKGREVAAQLPGQTEVRELDVADLGSVRRFAAAWSGLIDVLVNNAGIMEVPFARTVDGFESQFATNYLGPFVLTGLLLPHITDRVVTVTSQLHRMGKVHLDDLNSDPTRPPPLTTTPSSPRCCSPWSYGAAWTPSAARCTPRFRGSWV